MASRSISLFVLTAIVMLVLVSQGAEACCRNQPAPAPPPAQHCHRHYNYYIPYNYCPGSCPLAQPCGCASSCACPNCAPTACWALAPPPAPCGCGCGCGADPCTCGQDKWCDFCN